MCSSVLHAAALEHDGYMISVNTSLPVYYIGKILLNVRMCFLDIVNSISYYFLKHI